MNPETALAALLAWLADPAFKTTGRRVIHWGQVSDQPALFLRHIGDSDTFTGPMPRTTLECEVWIYSNAGQDLGVAPDSELNTLVQIVRGKFTPDADFRFTIDGLVYWARIEGRSDYAPGDQGGQAIARIPVRITLPGGL